MNRYRQLISDGISLSYLDEGHGDPVLFIHGFTGTALADHKLLMDEFRTEYRLIAPDLRGYGASRPPDRDFPTNFYQRDAADMAALLTSLNCGPAFVFGFSDGAEAALILAANFPELVRAVVAWGVCGVISEEEMASVSSWLPVSDWSASREAWKRQIIARHGEEQLEPMITGWVNAAKEIYAQGGNISYDTADKIRCPVLLMNGDREVGNTPRDVQRLAARIPHSQLVFVPDCGHSIQDDQPEVLIDSIRGFLNSVRQE